MKPTRTWILIADGARARILETHGPASTPIRHSELVFAGDHASTHDLMSDRQGRSHSSVGPGRSAIEPQTDPHRNLKAKFAHQLADVLAQGLQRNAYDRLVIVAAPVTLGDLRAALSDHVRAKVAGEVAKDLTKTPDNEIAGHLGDVPVG